MKKLFFLIVLLFASAVANADCLGYGTRCVWPSGNTISKNSIVIINTDESDLSIGLGTTYPAYLQSVKTRIKIQLSVIEICKGGLGLVQFVLKPSHEVVEGQEYELYISKDSKKPMALTTWSRQEKKYTPLIWVVKDQPVTNAPVWQKQPELTGKTYISYGCGPEVEIFFSLSGIAISERLVRATVKNKRTGKETVCYCIANGSGRIGLGHGMCSGEFKFEKEGEKDNDEYEVKFNLINENGNISLPSKSISFTQPNEVNNK